MSLRLRRSAAPIFFAWICFSLIQACDSQQPVDRKAVIEEMNARELKRIPETEIMQTAEDMGDSISMKAQKALQEALLSALQNGGVTAALEFCKVNALPIMKDVSDELGVEVYRVTDRPRNTQNEVDSLESLVLEAYQYNFENNLPIKSSVIKESNEMLLYTKPISITGGLCLNCHGKVGTEIEENNYDTILGYYPSDQAINYQLNDLRGMWVIRLPVKSIVSAL